MKIKSMTYDLSRFGGVGPLAPSIAAESAASVPSVPRDTGIVNAKNGSHEGRRVETTIESARDTRDSRGQAAAIEPISTFRYAGHQMEFGDVCAGWSPASWCADCE